MNDLKRLSEMYRLIILFVFQLQNGPIYSKIYFFLMAITIERLSKRLLTKPVIIWKKDGARSTSTLTMKRSYIR